ncbi:hypothetical protein C3K47_02405 [Solitalea longa]|uniref:DUF2975 domain-containing protein n=1 Tax=Solitalea longa TaxID=2079460 RepID=A0A2S5AAR3_9SPHI|nr:DUF2975 domain-containing protein [Solitalea longa]POY39369.1 hypothetical protein C3K47_02405 [Solitalea longa]
MKLTAKPKTRTEQILSVMHILAWVAFVAFMIEAGAMLFSFIVSCSNPEGAKNLYKGLNYYDLRQMNFWYYTGVVSFKVSIVLMKAFVWILVIKLFSKFNLENPFNMEIVKILEKISYMLFSIWLVGMTSSGYTAWLMKLTGKMYGDWVAGEYIFMAGLIFIISQIFKRGVELQSESDLTI